MPIDPALVQWDAPDPKKVQWDATPKAPQQPDTADRMMGSLPVRAALGAAAPVVGAAQLGANVGDVIAAKLGLEPTVGKDLQSWWQNVQAMKRRGMQAPTFTDEALAKLPESVRNIVAPIINTPDAFLDRGTDAAGFLGNLAVGAAGMGGKASLPVLGKLVEKIGGGQSVATTGLGKLAQGATIGAGFGAAQPGATLDQQMGGAAAGGVLGAAAPFVLPAAAKAAGWVWDAGKGRLVQVRAGKIIREIAGDRLPAIKAALAQAAPDETAAQAAVSATAPTFQALGAQAGKRNPEWMLQIAQQQEAARLAALQAVTPDKAAAEATRAAASQPHYKEADTTVTQMGDDILDIFKRLPKGTIRHAAELARIDGRPFIMGKHVPEEVVGGNIVGLSGKPLTQTTVPAQYPEITGESLHYIKRALSDIASGAPGVKGTTKDTQRAVRELLPEFLDVVEKAVPSYGAARRTFAELSPPVDQATVLNEMASILQKPGGGERVTPFLNVLGRGEQALLKHGTGFPRHEAGDLGKVLTGPGQMEAVGKVERELTRDKQAGEQAAAGMDRLRKIFGESGTGSQIPDTLNPKIIWIKRVIERLSGKVNDKTLSMLTEKMKTAKGAEELINSLPASERSAVLRALAQAGTARPAAATNALVGTGINQNALTEAQ